MTPKAKKTAATRPLAIQPKSTIAGRPASSEPMSERGALIWVAAFLQATIGSVNHYTREQLLAKMWDLLEVIRETCPNEVVIKRSNYDGTFNYIGPSGNTQQQAAS